MPRVQAEDAGIVAVEQGAKSDVITKRPEALAVADRARERPAKPIHGIGTELTEHGHHDIRVGR